MKRIVVALCILGFIDWEAFISFKVYSQGKKTDQKPYPSQFEKYKYELEGIKRLEGWKVPDIEIQAKNNPEEEKRIDIDGIEVLRKTYLIRQHPIMETEVYVISEDIRLEILRSECELGAISTFSIGGKEFARRAVFTQVMFSNGTK